MYVSLHLGFVRFTNIIQLFTHAELFFSNDCIEGIEYEATAGAIMIAGLFITFIIEYIAHRWVDRKRHMFERPSTTNPATAESSAPKEASEGTLSESSSSEQHYSPKSLTLNTTVMEAGIIFHSICKYHQSVSQRISIR
jgi:zinc transporter 1/2/3